uniref:Uncharacterized protein n=1 Tax=Oryza rufipogon TaxID=4529 RepID=A0A0E0NSL3_ORYRU
MPRRGVHSHVIRRGRAACLIYGPSERAAAVAVAAAPRRARSRGQDQREQRRCEETRLVICSMKNCEAPSNVPISDVPTARSENVSTTDVKPIKIRGDAERDVVPHEQGQQWHDAPNEYREPNPHEVPSKI